MKIKTALVAVLILALMCVPAYAADGGTDVSEPIETVAEATETETDLTSNIYSIIYDCWAYIFPADVIRDNSSLIVLFTMATTSLVVFLPIFLVAWVVTKRR